MNASKYLDVSIVFEPVRRVTIGFQHENLALAYHARVMNTEFHKFMCLESKQDGCNVSSKKLSVLFCPYLECFETPFSVNGSSTPGIYFRAPKPSLDHLERGIANSECCSAAPI